jgi:hypothetical protein
VSADERLRLSFPARFSFSGQLLREVEFSATTTLLLSDDTKGKVVAGSGCSFLLKWAFCESIIGLFNYGPLQMEMA